MSNQAERSDTVAEAFVVRHRNPLARDYVIVSRVVLVGYPDLSDGAKITYWVIYSHDWYEPARGGRKGYAFPTVGRLAQLRHTTPRTIQRHLAELIQAGLLTREIRRGKPSVLFIEEPDDVEIKRYKNEQSEGDDVSVGGGATFLSPQQEDERKQINPVNGIEESSMEKGNSNTKGWKPISALLGHRRLQKGSVDRSRWLAEQVVAQTGDPHSLGCYRTIAKRCPQDLVFEALSLLKEVKHEGTIRRTRGALFLGIVRRLCRERGLPEPLGGHRTAAAFAKPSGEAMPLDGDQGLPLRSGGTTITHPCAMPVHHTIGLVTATNNPILGFNTKPATKTGARDPGSWTHRHLPVRAR